jgi:hypothetical protein
MSEQHPPAPEERQPADVANVSGGVNLDASRDISIGGDVIGRDKITQTTNVTQVGMNPEAVRRLVITVGALVFITAFCFFAVGAVTAAAALNAFQRDLPSSPQAAADFNQNLNKIQDAPPGLPFRWQFSEVDLSSYMRFVLGPQLGMGETGRARFLSSQQVAFRGNWPGLGNLPVMAITSIQTNTTPIYKLDSSFVQILRLGDNLGWIPVPNRSLQPLIDQINNDIGTGYSVSNAQYPSYGLGGGPATQESPLTLSGTTQ